MYPKKQVFLYVDSPWRSINGYPLLLFHSTKDDFNYQCCIFSSPMKIFSANHIFNYFSFAFALCFSSRDSSLILGGFSLLNVPLIILNSIGRRRTLYFLHDYKPHDYSLTNIKSNLILVVNYLVSYLSTALVVFSDEAEAFSRKKYPNNVIFKYNLFSYLEEYRSHASLFVNKNPSSNSDCFSILLWGKNVRYKNFGQILDIAHQVIQLNNLIKFTFIGKDMSSLFVPQANLLESSNSIDIHDVFYSENVISLLNTTDATIFAYSNYTQSGVLVDAMLSGIDIFVLGCSVPSYLNGYPGLFHFTSADALRIFLCDEYCGLSPDRRSRSQSFYRTNFSRSTYIHAIRAHFTSYMLS